MAHELPLLEYAYDSLEPHIDAKTMEIHHGKHHAGYVNNLNAAVEKAGELKDKMVEELIGDLEKVSEEVRMAVRNNGGGHFNHSLFWQVMAKDGGKPSGGLAEAIERDFGNLSRLKEEFNQAAVSRFGSGWVWLVVDSGKLKVGSTPNQDNPLMKGVSDFLGIPILGLDVWEHAYYLKYQNKRAEYVENFWQVVNWEQVEKNFGKARV